MKEQDIIKIISSCNDDKIINHINILVEKSREIAKESNYLGIIMVISFLFYYILNFSKLENFEIGPLTINDLETIKLFFPLAFAFVIFRYV
ncbi:hypothetical protein [Chryseobacterium sp. FH1]|uniref:hypothetical protein n=1 Tax=Chryseobacterium sp. FH1 TaxID=1233951 RepID=UPI0004E428ED|nr:hypothetical protein [Chryseobacterium sp. FH1]KFC20564.1 hypothetical protein IO90_15605 [Chryseobacterium sp. FH1]